MKQRRKPESYRLRQQREQQYRGNDIRGSKASLIGKTECAIKPLLARQPGDRGESHKHTRDGNAKHLNYVALFVMANFMREDRFQFQFGELIDECVEQNDFSKSSKPGEEGVGVARAFAAIHYLDAACGKMGALRQCKEAVA